jgi:hypothetical protein
VVGKLKAIGQVKNLGCSESGIVLLIVATQVTLKA